jgi:hypothetical protein
MKRVTLLMTFTVCFSVIAGQVPRGFNYQAIARDGSNIPITSTIQVRIGFQTDTLLSTYIWEELHSTVKPNSTGVFSLVIGSGTRVSGVPAFSDIDWGTNQVYLKTYIYHNNTWKYMGAARLWSVPYSLVTGGMDGALDRLEVIGDDVTSDDALFEVRRKDGQTMFAVYNHGARVYMPLDTLSKARKGGFAIGGFSKAKGTVQDYFVVNPDSIRAYVDADTTDKGKKGGFAIGGFNKAKGTVVPFVDLTPLNYFIGHESGLVTTGKYNSFIGFQAGKSNTIGKQNIFLGYQAGKANLDGDYNIFIGYQAGFNTLGPMPGGFTGGSYGSFNCYIGYHAGFSSIHGSHNTMLGYAAGNQNTSGNNTFIGSLAGSQNTTGGGNTFLGTEAGSRLDVGADNVFLGRDAGRNVISGNLNTLVGSGTGANLGYGNRNVVIGTGAMGDNYFGGKGRGSSNIVIGFQAGYSLTDGSSNIFIGDQAGFSETGSNLFIVENSNSSTPLVYGNFTTKDFRINGNIQYTGTIANVSDIRFKRNIAPIENVIEKIGLINGIYYEWVQSDTIGLLLQEGRQIGVIAQEVEEVYPELVITTEKGYKMVDYAKLSTVLLEGIKEQQRQINSYKSENEALQSKLQALQDRVDLIEKILITASEK